MMNFHNPALVHTVTFNFAVNYQNVTMLRILMSDAQYKHVSYIVCTVISLCAHVYMQVYINLLSNQIEQFAKQQIL